MHYSINPSFQYSSLCCYSGLKRFFLILSALIFDSSVDEGIPSLAAAPKGPETRPLLSANAASIISVWRSDSFPAAGRDGGFGWSGFPDSQLSSTEKTSPSHRITDLSIRFCSSRTLPVQSWD